MERKALYAGSFDPVTNGHLNIIERAAKMYDSLTVAIANNPQKTGLFTIEERVDIAREVTRHIPNVKVDTFAGLIADYVNDNGFTAYIRGLRNVSDFESELLMAQMNARLFTGGTETVFLMTEPEHSFISSSLVKEVASFGGSIDGLVPEYVLKRIKEKLG
ncbi:MAG: pantetheine-phosphate adenylyltransferase [Mogibacterium sp.]|jgi:pantetheine-phosphate adenylyltransferase|nr:pantetheine-phosphate adenylyltransferase [Mogibacterium sp.]